jgi:hypothetical protein
MERIPRGAAVRRPQRSFMNCPDGSGRYNSGDAIPSELSANRKLSRNGVLRRAVDTC